jgi:hypothetical protein
MKKYFCCILLICAVWKVAGSYNLRERVFLQTDKHLYLAGEPVLMKLLTTDAELIPLTFSKVAYVELVADSVSLLQIKIELTDGTGVGRMLLPVDLPTGYYRLIAYTQFMRNEGVDVFFEKNIAVVNTFSGLGFKVSGLKFDVLNDANKPETSNFKPQTEQGDRKGAPLQTDKTAYTTRARGELVINGLPDNIHTFSVSIAGKDFVHVDGSDAELFRKNMTKKPATATARLVEYLPEYEGHIIAGKIIDNQNEKAGNADILLSPGLAFTGEGIRFFAGQKTETGDVRFFTMGISGTKEIATVLYHADEKYRLDIQSPFVSRYVSRQMPTLYIDSVHYGQLLARSVAVQAFHYFSYQEDQNIPESFYRMKPSMSYPLDDYTRFTTMREVFIEFIIGARFRKKDGKQELQTFTKRGGNYVYGTMPLVLLDGAPVSDHDAIYSYDPLSVERINIYYGPCVLGGYLFDGIVELTTYRRLHADLNLNRSSQIISYEGPQSPYQWITPDYSDEKNRRSRIPDSRHTLLWNPDVCVDGKTSIRLPFDTSDLTGEFQATVEGITKDGELFYATSFFSVESQKK